jgi:hypothetical protein
MYRHSFWALAFLAASAVSAQQPVATPTSANRAIYSVSGIVIDSLRWRPLAGADVIAAGTSHHATTDSSGLFRIDSLMPGMYRLGVFHPYLDSLSIAIGTKETMVPLEEGKGLIFGVPSAASLIRTTCPESAVDSSSVLLGTVVDVDTGAPIPSAKVTVSWTDYVFGKKIRGLEKVPQRLETMTNSGGAYRVCGLPADLGAAVVAESGEAKTDEIGIKSFSPSVLLLTLAISRKLAARTPVKGFVRDERGSPLKNARVQMIGAAAGAVTGDDGSFTLHDIAPGTRNIAIRRIGYIPVSISLQLTDKPMPAIDVRLAKYVPILDTVFIKGRRDERLASVGFTHRKAGTIGEFLTRDAWQKSHPRLLTDILRNTRQATVRHVGTKAIVVSRRGLPCTKLLIDGVPWNIGRAEDFNDVIDATEVSALEIYSGSTVPSEFDLGREHGCLTIVIWSRSRVQDNLR